MTKEGDPLYYSNNNKNNHLWYKWFYCKFTINHESSVQFIVLCVLSVYFALRASTQQYVHYYPLPFLHGRLLHRAMNWSYIPFLNSLLCNVLSLKSASKCDHPCDWLSEWTDEAMAALFFPSTLRHWHSYLPWRHFHLHSTPLPPPFFPSLCSYPIQRLLFISFQASQSSQDCQPTNQIGTQLQWTYWPPLQLYRIRHEKHSKPQAPSSLAQFIVSPSLLLVGTCCNLPQLPPLTTPNKVTGRSTALRNKQTLQPRTDTHIKLGQRGF